MDISTIATGVTTEDIKGVDISTIAIGDGKFLGICAAGNKVVLTPYSATQLLVFDVTMEEVKGVDIPR